jgi:hypothetical protein
MRSPRLLQDLVSPAGPQPPRRGRDEQGSIILAMTVLMVLTGLSTLVLMRSLVVLAQVRKGQDFSAALATADAGLADALFQIDQATPPSIRVTGTAGSGTYTYLATRIDDDTYDVQSLGTVGVSNHAIRATVRRTARFPYAIFSNQNLTFDGNGFANIYSYDVPGGPASGKARVGSNHAIVVNSGAGAGDFQDFFSPGGSCVNCPKPVPRAGPYDVSAPVVPPGPTQACPASGVFTGIVDGRGGVPFVCSQDVTISGEVTVVNGPLLLYVTGENALDMTGSVVNKGQRAGNVRVFKEGSGALVIGNGSHAADFTGVLHAPRSDVTINGGEQVNGSLNVNAIKINGSPNFTLAYDTSLGSIIQTPWTVTDWREVPSTSVSL